MDHMLQIEFSDEEHRALTFHLRAHFASASMPFDPALKSVLVKLDPQGERATIGVTEMFPPSSQIGETQKR